MPRAHRPRHMNEDHLFSSGQQIPPGPWLRAWHGGKIHRHLKRTSLEVPAFVTHPWQAPWQVNYGPPSRTLLLGTAPATGHLSSPREQRMRLHSTGREMKSSSHRTTPRARLLIALPWPGLLG